MMQRATIKHPEQVTFKLLLNPAQKGAKAVDEAAYWYGHAANIFDMIFSGIASGHFRADDPKIASLAEICAFTFRQLAETQGEDLQRLAQDMRGALLAHEERKQAETGDAS